MIITIIVPLKRESFDNQKGFAQLTNPIFSNFYEDHAPSLEEELSKDIDFSSCNFTIWV